LKDGENISDTTGTSFGLDLNQAIESQLPTPQSRDYRSPNRVNSESPYPKLNETIHNTTLPTPIAGDWKGQKRKVGPASMLSGKISETSIPTPRANDYKGASAQTVEKGRNPLTNSCMDAVENSPDGTRTGLKLQPGFVEWMMGYPIGYTDLKLSGIL
jgi:hypothetical protein